MSKLPPRRVKDHKIELFSRTKALQRNHTKGLILSCKSFEAVDITFGCKADPILRPCSILEETGCHIEHVLDYQNLNKVTINNKYLSPLILTCSIG